MAKTPSLQGPLTMKIVYWVTTVPMVLFILFGAVLTFISADALHMLQSFGFPTYFLYELSVAKILGGIVLLFPMIPARLREWAYVGYAIDFISAAVALWAVGGPAQSILAFVFIVILAVSYWSWHKLSDARIASMA